MVMRYKNPSRYLTKTHSGFTLIELLVVISIAAIIMAIAVPSFNQLVGQQRVKAAANDFKSAVALARSEARKRGVNTSIRPIGKTGIPWGTVDDGWYVYYNDGSTMKTVLEHQLESGSIQVTGGNAGFDLLGGTGRLGVGIEETICFEDSNNTSNIPAYIVSVNQAGFVVVTESASCPA
jgi:type IV fimbrial biogenesis protein FimT